jgi:hypothetical protein
MVCTRADFICYQRLLGLYFMPIFWIISLSSVNSYLALIANTQERFPCHAHAYTAMLLAFLFIMILGTFFDILEYSR